ncbi:UNVERIFIED_CONTAM: Pentatricopeptide repeat-containing protein [Sesamum latifolium]|uniref:Pentatricopeptide repeat-containing protein n=1 Tax=Sesamum latifolium TaxID=2727402 RepID=A0AAW2Y7B0_9LAMI
MDIKKLLKASSGAKNIKFGKSIHAHLVVSNQISRDRVIERNSLINAYSKCGDIASARLLFDRMPKKNVVSWGSIMAGYLQHGCASEVIELCRCMVKVDKLCPNKYILATVLASCSNCGLLNQGQQCHGYALKSGLIFHQYVKNALVYMYSMLSDVKEAMRDLNLGRQVHSRILKTGVDCDLFVGSATVDMYGKCGEISSMRRVFDGLHTKSEVTWTAVLTAYSHNECFEEALKLFLEMDLQNVVPNEYTFAV